MTADPETENDPRLVRWDHPLALALLGLPALVVLAATFVSSGATRIYTWPWAFYVQAALLAPWLWCAWSITRGRTGLREAWWIALPLLTALVLSIATSAHWHDALEASLPLTTPLILLPFAAQTWRDASAASRLLALRCAGAVFGLLALTSLSVRLHQAPDTGVLAWLISTRNPHPLGHWNYTGGLALLAIPIASVLAYLERGFRRTAWVVVAALGLLQLVSSGSRGAVLGLLTGLMVAAALLAVRRTWPRRHLAVGATVLTGLAALAIATNPRIRQAVTDPFAAVRIGASEQQRLGFILTGVGIAQAHPWTGIGPGTTPYHYPAHRIDIPGGLENAFQLHCGPVQWWVDTGSLGILALLVALAPIAVRVARARRTLTPAAIAMFVLLASYGVMGLTDYQLDAPIFPVVLAWAAAVLVGETDREARSSRQLNRALGFGLAVATLATAVVLTPSWRARASFAAAWAAKDSGDANSFIKELRTAAETASWQPYYHNHVARALAGVAAHLPEETAAALRHEAGQAWQRSLEAAADQDHPWLNLGWLALADGRGPDAATAFGRAAAIQPRRTGLWFATALAQLPSGQPDTVARALAREVRLDPGFITSPLWNDPMFSALRAPVVALLSEGWKASGTDRGAAAAPGIEAFARWWWFEELPAETATARGLPWLMRIDDPDTASDPATLPTALCALREHWRTGAPPAAKSLAPELVSSWTGHVAAHPGTHFSQLIRTWPVSTSRQVQRRADGILFRQADGDPLSDLTEIPSHPVAAILAPVLPQPAVGEFLDPIWTARPARP